MKYIGRFAPSPTGPLHFGSLIAAVASYCDAKAHHGIWLVRMEDIDKPREMPGATDGILRTLEAFGFAWDDEIVYQSQRSAMYAEALTKLQAKNLIYPCTCTRKEIADSSQMMGIEGAIYPKICYPKTANLSTNNFNASANRMDTASQRINVDDAGFIAFKDEIQGDISQHLAHDIGDFILKRKDGLFAYQLAVVVDDSEQGVTHVVRGADLLDSTPRQIYLQQLLGAQTPHYAHVPVATNAQGEKLSKQTLASALDTTRASIKVFEALSFLGQHPPEAIKNATLDEVWRWAITNWQLATVPKSRSLIKNHT
jgi:glutamyl-Q tRNA(Asp) synthetase